MFKNDNGIFYVVPNGSAWQAKGKKIETSRYLIQSLTLFGIATLVYLGTYTNVVIGANLLKEPAIVEPGTFPLTIGYIMFAIAWFFAFFNRFGSGRLSEANE
jgi:ABC-type multidrug transport system fused ATPase/permease subunit